jgi:hypothetical protein
MKKIFMLILTVFLQADILTIKTQINNMQNYTPKFKNIKKYNVFIDVNLTDKKTLKKNTGDLREANFVLNAVFQNRANINGIWVEKGDNIEGYEIVRVLSDGVVLKKGKKTKKIILKSNILKVVK